MIRTAATNQNIVGRIGFPPQELACSSVALCFCIAQAELLPVVSLRRYTEPIEHIFE
jgi:hypothetical protein